MHFLDIAKNKQIHSLVCNNINPVRDTNHDCVCFWIMKFPETVFLSINFVFVETRQKASAEKISLKVSVKRPQKKKSENIMKLNTTHNTSRQQSQSQRWNMLNHMHISIRTQKYMSFDSEGGRSQIHIPSLAFPFCSSGGQPALNCVLSLVFWTTPHTSHKVKRERAHMSFRNRTVFWCLSRENANTDIWSINLS